jgi:hypothetical protein
MKTRGVTTNPIMTHLGGRLNKIPKLKAIKADRKAPACIGLISPVVKGLALVLSTCLSMSRSVKSLIIQPALRAERAPKVNNPIVHKLGISVGELRASPQ